MTKSCIRVADGPTERMEIVVNFSLSSKYFRTLDFDVSLHSDERGDDGRVLPHQDVKVIDERIKLNNDSVTSANLCDGVIVCG